MAVPDPLSTLAAWQRFHLRITAVYAAVVVVVLLAAAAVGYRLLVDTHLDGLRARILLGAQSVAGSIPPDALAGELDDATRDLLDARFATLGDAFPDIDSIYVLRYDADPRRLVFVYDWSSGGDDAASPGERYDASDLPILLAGFDAPVAEQDLYEDDWGLSMSAYAPVRAPDGGPLALVGIDVLADEVAAIEARVLRITVLGAAGVLGVLALVTVFVGRQVREPLAEVITAADALARGSLDTRVGLVRTDEFGILATRFDRMAAGLAEREFLRETFGRYVSPDVARRLIAANEVKLGGESREVTVLLSDLAGYSTYSEALEPTQLVRLLNRYLGAMQDAIDAEGGTVLEFVGDAIVAVFNAPSDQPDHASRALRAALGMREAMAAVNAACEADGLADLYRRVGMERLHHRIGVHTGQVVAGNIGSATRIKYTVIGDAVNVAARLEALNKELGTEILCSESTRVVAADELVADAVDHGEVRVKGRAAAVRVWQV